MKLIKQPEVIFENNAINSLGKIMKTTRADNVLVVTDPGIIKCGIYRKLKNVLLGNSVENFLYSDVTPDPSLDLIDDVLNFALDKKIDFVIGIGGGSSIDTAKVVSALLTNRKSIYEYIGTDLLENDAVPLVAIPTTAGTGSEVTPIAILSDEKEQLKKGIVSEKIIPKYALLDPVLTTGMPKQITAYTGMDALAHAVEAFTSVNANDYTDALAQKAISLILENIEKAYNDGDNLQAREKMMLGSLMAGIAFANAGVTAVHAFAYPLGGMFHVPHGLANSIMLEPIINFNSQGNSAKFRELALCFDKNSNSPDVIIEKLRELNAVLDIPKSLKELNIPETAITQLSEGAMKVTRLLANNPRKITLEDAKMIYGSIL